MNKYFNVLKDSKYNQYFLLGLVGIGFFGCAHHRDVRPGVDGIHRVVIKSDNTEDSKRDAIAQANHYCESKGKGAAFMDESESYGGSMKEEDYRRAKTASKVATGAGGAVHVFGGKKESAVGGIVGLGGIIADQALGNAYTIEMKFKCQ